MSSSGRSDTNPTGNGIGVSSDVRKNSKNVKHKKASFFFLLCVIVVWVGILLVELASIIIGALQAWINPTQWIKTE